MALKHLSLNAQDPRRVASLLASLLGGEALPFPPFPDSWIAFSSADDGSAIEVYPDAHRLKAGPDRIECYSALLDRDHSFVHVAFGSRLRLTKSLPRRSAKAGCRACAIAVRSSVSRYGWKTGSWWKS